jgi:hypothetical protein
MSCFTEAVRYLSIASTTPAVTRPPIWSWGMVTARSGPWPEGALLMNLSRSSPFPIETTWKVFPLAAAVPSKAFTDFESHSSSPVWKSVQMVSRAAEAAPRLSARVATANAGSLFMLLLLYERASGAGQTCLTWDHGRTRRPPGRG